MTDEWRDEFAIPWALRLTANEKLHWRKRAEKVKALRTLAAAHAFESARQSKHTTKSAHVEVWTRVYPPDRRRRDSDNFWPLLKATCDGIATALLPDDTPEYMTKHAPEILSVVQGGCIVIAMKVTPRG